MKVSGEKNNWVHFIDRNYSEAIDIQLFAFKYINVAGVFLCPSSSNNGLYKQYAYLAKVLLIELLFA